MAQTTRPASFGPVFVVAAFPVPRLSRVQQKKVLVNMKKQYFKRKTYQGLETRRVSSPYCFVVVVVASVSVTSAPTTRGGRFVGRSS